MEINIMENISLEDLERKRIKLSRALNMALASSHPDGDTVKQGLNDVWEIIHEIERRKRMVS